MLAQNKAHTRNQGDNRILYEGGRAAGYFGTDGVYYGGRNCKYLLSRITFFKIKRFIKNLEERLISTF